MIIPKAIEYFQRNFPKAFFQKKNILVWVQLKEENLQDQNQVLSESKNEALAMKENMLRGKVLLEEKNSIHFPQNKKKF